MSFRNLGIDLVRVTEAAAIAAGHWMGLGNADDPDRAAAAAMIDIFRQFDVDGRILVSEAHRHDADAPPLTTGQTVGSGRGIQLDVVVDPVDGRALLAGGLPGSLSVAGIAPRGTLWAPSPAAYMQKLVVDADAAEALVPECLDAPAAWTLALIARVKGKDVSDLVVFVLDRPRHADLIREIRRAGARIMLHPEGDLAGSLLAASPDHPGVDVMFDVGGVTEGVIAACAVKAIGGNMLGRLSPQSEAERTAVADAGLDPTRILTADDIVQSDEVFFAATGITDGPLLDGVRYRSGIAETQSLVLRAETGTRRTVFAMVQER